MFVLTTQRTNTSAPAPYALSASLPILKSNLSLKWAQRSEMCRIAMKTAHVHSKTLLKIHNVPLARRAGPKPRQAKFDVCVLKPRQQCSDVCSRLLSKDPNSTVMSAALEQAQKPTETNLMSMLRIQPFCFYVWSTSLYKNLSAAIECSLLCYSAPARHQKFLRSSAISASKKRQTLISWLN